MNLKWLLALPVGAIISYSVWAMDQRYITKEDLAQYERTQYVRQLGDRIDELTIKKGLNMSTEYEDAILEQLKEKVERVK